MSKVNVNFVNELELQKQFDDYKEKTELIISELKEKNSKLDSIIKHNDNNKVIMEKRLIDVQKEKSELAELYSSLKSHLDTLTTYLKSHLEDDSIHISKEKKTQIELLLKTPQIVSAGGGGLRTPKKDDKVYVMKNKKWQELVFDDNSGLTIIDGGDPYTNFD